MGEQKIIGIVGNSPITSKIVNLLTELGYTVRMVDAPIVEREEFFNQELFQALEDEVSMLTLQREEPQFKQPFYRGLEKKKSPFSKR